MTPHFGESAQHQPHVNTHLLHRDGLQASTFETIAGIVDSPRIRATQSKGRE